MPIGFGIGSSPIGGATIRGIQVDVASNSGYQAAASSYSWAHVCTGADRYLVVGIAMLSLAQTVSGITYNSIAMTLLGVKNSVSGACRVELWGLKAPSTGSNTIAVTLTGVIASAGIATSFVNVHQTSSTEAFNSAQATNVGAADATVDVTSIADLDFVVDIVATDDAAITVGAGQVQQGNVTGAGGSGAMSTEGPKSPAGAVTMSWTDVGALATWAIGGIALRPVTAAALTTSVFHDAWGIANHVYPYRKPFNAWTRVTGDYKANPAQIGIFFNGAWADPNDVFAYRKPTKNYWTKVETVYQENPANVGIFYTDSWSDPAYVYQYKCPTKNDSWKNVKTVFESNPAQIGIFYTDSWSDPAFVFQYKKPVGNYWTRVQPVYQSNPATIGIFYADSWSDPAVVYPYPRLKGNYWTKVNGDYEANPNTLGIFFEAAWMPQAYIYQYRSKPKYYSMLPEVIEHEPFVIKVTYADAWAGNEVNQTKYYRKRSWLQEYYTVDSIALQRRIEMTYNDSFTESAVASDSLANTVIYNVTFSESAAASDTIFVDIDLFDGSYKGRQYGSSTTSTVDGTAEYGKGRDFGASTTFEADADVTYTKGRNYD